MRDLPRSALQWLALFTPAVAALLALLGAALWMPPVPLPAEMGAVITRQVNISLPVISVGSLLIAYGITRRQTLPRRVGTFLGWTVCLIFLNSLAAFAGCTFAGFAASLV
jgi:hypothetical protein